MVEPTRVDFRTKRVLANDDDTEIPAIEQVAIEMGSSGGEDVCVDRIIPDIKFVTMYPDACSAATDTAEAILNMLAHLNKSEELFRKVDLVRARMCNASLASLCATLERSAPGLWEPQQVYYLALATEFGARMMAIHQYQMNHGSFV